MIRYTPFAATLLLLLAGPVSSSFAQPIPPVMAPRPAYSPYLNLLWGFGSPAFNYFGLVQPQLQMQQQNMQMQLQMRQTSRNIQMLNNELSSFNVYGINPNIRATGFIPMFNNTGHYFNSNPAVRGSSAGGGRLGGIGGFGTFGGGMMGSRLGARAPAFTRPGGSALGTSRTAGPLRR